MESLRKPFQLFYDFFQYHSKSTKETPQEDVGTSRPAADFGMLVPWIPISDSFGGSGAVCTKLNKAPPKRLVESEEKFL
jgi:hypothetical protein